MFVERSLIAEDQPRMRGRAPILVQGFGGGKLFERFASQFHDLLMIEMFTP